MFGNAENSYATISRFILLDSMLLFFTFTTMLCFARFHNLQKRSFGVQWWLWLFLSGLSIGCVCRSVLLPIHGSQTVTDLGLQREMGWSVRYLIGWTLHG